MTYGFCSANKIIFGTEPLLAHSLCIQNPEMHWCMDNPSSWWLWQEETILCRKRSRSAVDNSVTCKIRISDFHHFQRSTALAAGSWYMTESGIPYQWVGRQLLVVFSFSPVPRRPFKARFVPSKYANHLTMCTHETNLRAAPELTNCCDYFETCCEWGQTFCFQTLLSMVLGTHGKGTHGKRGDSMSWKKCEGEKANKMAESQSNMMWWNRTCVQHSFHWMHLLCIGLSLKTCGNHTWEEYRVSHCSK